MKIMKFLRRILALLRQGTLFVKRLSFSQTLFFPKTLDLSVLKRKEFEKTQLSQARKLRSKKTSEQSEPSWFFMTFMLIKNVHHFDHNTLADPELVWLQG